MDKSVIWKSTIVILTEYDPYGVSIEDLGYEAERGDAYCLSKTSQPATLDEIAQAGSFFFPDEVEDEPSWVDRHSVNCVICGDLYDERTSIKWLEDGGEVCPKHKKDLTDRPYGL